MHHALVFALVLLVAPARAQSAAPKQAHVVVYDGWGTPTSLRLSGRLLERAADPAPDQGASAAQNLVASLDALESDEIAGAELEVYVSGQTFSATTDVDGNFAVVAKHLPAAQALTLGRVDVDVRVVAPVDYRGQRGAGSLFVHPEGPSSGLISDIDDTVVKTFVTDKARMLEQVLLKNAAQLEPVSGAAKNYQEAQKKGPLAFFYVSGSPQNLYVKLHRFLDDNGFPGGSMVLKNLGDDSLFSQDDYKLDRIEKILAAFPQMRFVLVGDSGERDPEIYLRIRARHPERVLAIVIRKVAGSKHLEPARFAGCTLVGDAYANDAVIAGLLTTASTPSAASVAAPVLR